MFRACISLTLLCISFGQGPKKRALEKQITKAVSAKKKSLENSLQVFLKNEGYGEIPEHLSSNEPEDPTTHGMDTASKDVKEADAPIIQESPSESGMILTKGLSLWMSGIAKVLTGPQEEIDLVKQLLQDEEAKLLLMKANAEVSVFGRELLPDEREAAWGKAHDDRLTFLRPAVEAQVLGRPLLDDERDQAWESGAKKKALFKAYSATVKRQRDKLRQTLESIQQADERMEQAASRQQAPSLDRPAVLNLTGTTSGSQDNAGKSPDTISHASTESDASSLRTAAREEAQARFQVLFSRATTPNETHGDLQSDRFGELGDDSRHTSFPDTPVAHVARPASAIDTENLGNADDADSQHGGVLQIVAVAHTAAADMDQIGLDDTSLQEVVEALGGKVLAPRAPEAPAESRPGTQSSVQTDKAIADEQGLHVLDRNNDGLVDEEEFREYTSSLHMVQYGASRVRISGVVLYNGGSAQPYTGINGDYVRSEEVCNFRAVYVKEDKPGIAMWWANIVGTISWCVGPKDQVGKDGIWAHVESMGFGPEEAGTRAWTVYSYNSGSWEEQTGVEVENLDPLRTESNAPYHTGSTIAPAFGIQDLRCHPSVVSWWMQAPANADLKLQPPAKDEFTSISEESMRLRMEDGTEVEQVGSRLREEGAVAQEIVKSPREYSAQNKLPLSFPDPTGMAKLSKLHRLPSVISWWVHKPFTFKPTDNDRQPVDHNSGNNVDALGAEDDSDGFGSVCEKDVEQIESVRESGHLKDEELEDADRPPMQISDGQSSEVKLTSSALQTDVGTGQNELDNGQPLIDQHEELNEHERKQDDTLNATDHQTVQTSDGQYAEIMLISSAPQTAGGQGQTDLDDAALQQRISMYTDVDVEVIESRPGTQSSVHLRPRTSDSRPFTGLSGERPQTSHTGRSGAGSRDGQSRPRTGEASVNPIPASRSGSRDGQSRPGTGEDGAHSHAGKVSTVQHADVWAEAEETEELDTEEVDLTVTHETALWSFNSLLKFMQRVDPLKLEEKAKKDAEQARRARLKAEARKRKAAVAEDTKEKEVYDVDKPDKDVDIEILQSILFMLDQLQATTNPGSGMKDKSTEVLIKIANERMCRRNIAFPARGIPSLNFLVIETMKPYLWHPDKSVRIVTIECVSKIARRTDAGTFKLLGQLAGDEDPDIKASAVAAISAITTADDGDDEEDMKNPLVRKMLTVTVKAASNLVAADASGTSDPFATVALQAFDADIDEIKTMRSQNFGSAKELMKATFEETMEEAPSMVELALKRMQLKRALILEVREPHCPQSLNLKKGGLTAPNLRIF